MSKFYTDWFKAEGSKNMSEPVKQVRAVEKSLLSRQGNYDVGVPDITANMRLKNFPEDGSEDRTRRALINGDIPSEDRENDYDPYVLHVNSYPPIDPEVDLRGIEQIARAAGKSERHTKRLIHNPKSGFPFDKLLGIYYSCQSSVSAWLKK